MFTSPNMLPPPVLKIKERYISINTDRLYIMLNLIDIEQVSLIRDRKISADR